MHFISSLKQVVMLLPILAGVAFADAITPDAISRGGADTRDMQLREIRDVMRGGRGGFLDIGFNYTPFETQLPLESKYGEHKGFATKQHVAGFGSGEVGSDNHLGLLLWFERQGWDGEDYFFFPKYNEFSLMRSVTTWGLSYTKSRYDISVAGGMQHSNVEHVGNIYLDESDSLAYSWAHLRYGHASVQGSFYRTDWRQLRISLDLESRALYGGRRSGILTYLPNFEVSLYNRGDDKDDSLLVFWEQNLFQQSLYGEVTFNFPEKEFHSAALKYYPDPSRMVAFEATCLRRNTRHGSKDLLWGGGVEFPFVRVAYNSSYEYEHFFGAKGTWLVEFQFNLGAIDGFLFSRGASQTAPMENQILDKKKNYPNKNDGSLSLPGSESSSKTVTAKGVRYENAGSTSSEGGRK